MRPRIPTAIHELKGSFKKDPARGRARDFEPQPPRGIGPCLEHLDDQHRSIWDEYVKDSAPGVLTCSDRMAFELLVRLTWQMRHDYKNMKIGDKTQLRQLLAVFGFNPSDRSRVQVPPKKGKNPYAEFL